MIMTDNPNTVFAQERRSRRMHAVDAQVIAEAEFEVEGADEFVRVTARAAALADLRERQARWMFAAGNRIWQASLDRGEPNEAGLDMCRVSGELRRQAELLRLALQGAS